MKETTVAVENGTYIQIYIYRRTVSRCLSRLHTSSTLAHPLCSFFLSLPHTCIDTHVSSFARTHVSLVASSLVLTFDSECTRITMKKC